MAAEDSRADYIGRNRRHWDAEAPAWVEAGRRAWQSEPTWGNWGIPERDLRLLPDLSGKLTLEVGCGTAYVSAWFARAGASPVALDNSAEQLATAALLQAEFELSFPLIHGVGESLPFKNESFDLVFSEYGAAIWSNPYVWIPEASRVLRPGGELIFLGNSALHMLCAPDFDGIPAENMLLRPQFGMHRFEWPDEDSVEFHLSHGDMIRLLHSADFQLLDLIELQASDGPADTIFNVSREWAQQWPSEDVWRARKRGG